MSDAASDATPTLYQVGLQIRREVLGDAYVDGALYSGDGFKTPLQDYITEVCWGRIWARDGLPRATRSLLNLAMLTALGRSNELRLHVRGALNTGCTPEQIAEVLLQAAVYCGVPAALEAFNVAEEILTSTATSRPAGADGARPAVARPG